MPRRRRSLSSRLFAAALLLLLVYGVVHYAALYTLGWRRLYELMGERAYNALIPIGGWPVMAAGYAALLLLAGLCALWRWFTRIGVRRYVLLALVLFVGLPLAAALRRHSPSELGGMFVDGIFAQLVEPQTVYAAGYSEEAFDAVHAGLTEAEVLALLGLPLRTWSGGGPASAPTHYAAYARAADHGSYWTRTIRYRSGIVDHVNRRLWVD